MGWKLRDWYLPAAAADAFDRNGNAGPTLWVDGRVVGAWAQAPDGEGICVADLDLDAHVDLHLDAT